MTSQGIGSQELLPEPTLLDVVTDLRRDVEGLGFEFDLPGTREARDSAERLLGQLDDHLLPRLRELSTPAVVVIAGSTGAGKSTLLNSLLRAEVSEASVIRPTTRQPVLAFHPADADLMASSALLPSVRTITHDGVPRGLALLDAPDLDSLLASNREMAGRMLDAGDLWLFVTTAARYGDALPWQALERAKERGASVALVLNRVSKGTLAPVRSDLLGRLRDHGMTGVPLFVVEDAGPHEGLLAEPAIAPVKRWLRTLAGSDHARTVILRTLRGSLAALPPWVEGLLAAVEHEQGAVEGLQHVLEGLDLVGLVPFERALEADGFAGGVLESRWQQIVAADPGLLKVSSSRWLHRSRRAVERRDGVLGVAIGDVRDVVAAQLETAIGADAAAVEAALTGADGPEGGPELFATVEVVQQENRPRAITTAVADWVSHVRRTLDELLGMEQTRDVFERAVRTVGDEGLVGLVLIATAGVEGAQRVLNAVVGSAGHELVSQLRQDLVLRAGRAVEQGRAPYLARLDKALGAADTAVGLRLRLAELKRAV